MAGSIKLLTPSGGSVTINANDTASTLSLTLPANNDSIITANTSQTLSNKTLTNPVINGFTGNTGIINIGSGQIYKDANGNVGIGTNAPNSILHVEGAGANFYLKSNNTTDAVVRMFVNGSERGAVRANSSSFMSFDTAGTTRLTIDNSGNLGIGTTSPTTILTLRKPIDSSAYGSGTNMLDFKSYFPGYDIETVKASIYCGVDGGVTPLNTQNGFFAIKTASAGVLYERLRIDAAGNVGIGTSSPASWGRLAIYDSSAPTGTYLSIIGGYPGYAGAHGYGIKVYDKDNTTPYFSVASDYSLTINRFSSIGVYTTSLKLDSSGNLGLGVTPSAWGSAWKAYEYIGGSIASPNGSNNLILQNAYATSANYIYKNSGLASNYQQSAGQHLWNTAPSGTAGNVITWTQAMTLDASGNLLVGVTTLDPIGGRVNGIALRPSGAGLQIRGTGNSFGLPATSGTQLQFYTDTGAAAQACGNITSSGTTTAYNTTSDQRLKTNIIPAGSAIQSILDFPIDQFDWTSDGSHVDFGAIAQKAIDVIPEMVHTPTDPEEMWGIDWSKAVPRLIKTIQELTTRLENIESKIK